MIREKLMRSTMERAGITIPGHIRSERILVLSFGLALMALAVLLLLGRSASGAATLPTGFQEELVDDGLSAPTAMALAPDGRIFVAEQAGRLRVIKDGQLLTTPFVDRSEVVDPRGARGLLGVAFDPNFASNGYVYVYFTRKTMGTNSVHNRIVRYTAEGDRAVADSGKLIIRLDDLSAATNHNGGAMHFGKDGKLYVAVGENANPDNSQSLKNLLGKMLRLNKDGTIPQDNPYYDSRRVRGKDRAIWARGLRNPYSFAVQPGTGTIFINDVGAASWEEINRGARGANYGWPFYEGSGRRPGSSEPPPNLEHEPPIFAYSHGATGTEGGCAITGGDFYNPQTVQFPSEYVGDYFFADFCRGWIRSYDPATDTASDFATEISNPVDLKVGPDGSLYYLERGTGSLYRIEHPGT
jgi:glucose/arabinose dehydrogenase